MKTGHEFQRPCLLVYFLTYNARIVYPFALHNILPNVRS